MTAKVISLAQKRRELDRARTVQTPSYPDPHPEKQIQVTLRPRHAEAVADELVLACTNPGTAAVGGCRVQSDGMYISLESPAGRFLMTPKQARYLANHIRKVFRDA